MLPLRKILALLLAVLWLPAAQHCMLEAAGLLSAQEDHAVHQNCCESESGACDAEACNLVESGNYQPNTAPIAVSAPVLTVCACVLCSPVEEFLPKDVLSMGVSAASFDRPPDCSPTWQFVERAARLPRAPSLSVA